jgi:hypothetical protein
MNNLVLRGKRGNIELWEEGEQKERDSEENTEKPTPTFRK